tara:strand:- start:301 stop:939 length:639 start_codon:yes stop_codon:yes gene_type:complete
MYLDFLGTICALLATILLVKGSVKAWPMSIAAILINCWLYVNKGIYAHFFLESFYFISSIYGWVIWQKKSTGTLSNVPKPINLSLISFVFYLSLTGLVYYFTYWVLVHFTNSNIPALDAITTALSICAQLMMCQKIITTWLIWFIADLILVLVYWYKGLPFHALLMIIYTTLSVLGYMKWLKLKETKRHDQLPFQLKSNDHASYRINLNQQG